MQTDFTIAAGGKRPFVASHSRRTDKLPAMLLGIGNGDALYRVRWFENGKLHENTLSRPEAIFRSLFARVTA